MKDLKNKKALVIGMGISGISAAVFLAGRGANVRVTESGDGPEISKKAGMLMEKGIEVETGAHTETFCRGSEIVVVSPGVDLRTPLMKSIIPPKAFVIGELELGAMFCEARIVAITGTNGKSTTTELIGKIISDSGHHAEVCGNIGTPLISFVDSLKKDSYAVVEVSSFQLETIKTFKPHVALLLNVTDDHYDRHADIEEYKKAKFRIFMNQDRNDWAILHSSLADEPLCADIKARKIFYDSGTETGIDFTALKMHLKGVHNIENLTSSAIAAQKLGIDKASIMKTISDFKGLRHRFETVAEINGVEYIDDSKGTNVDATKRALESLSKKAVLIAGGIDKGGDYLVIGDLVREKVRSMVVIGQAKDKIAAAFSPLVPVIFAGSMEEAVRTASKEAQKGDAVLLSPMCSSFDMFANYKERGKAFQKEVARHGQ